MSNNDNSEYKNVQTNTNTYRLIEYRNIISVTAYLYCQMLLRFFSHCPPFLQGWFLYRSPILLILN